MANACFFIHFSCFRENMTKNFWVMKHYNHPILKLFIHFKNKTIVYQASKTNMLDLCQK